MAAADAENVDRLARVLRLCEEALSRDGPERLAYLADACGGDDIRREVEALVVRADETDDGFLATAAWQHTQPELTLGQRLGPYEVIGSIGCGGMGAVYKARDTRLGRTVAIKVVASGSSDALRESFAREAQAIAAINHPNICAIYDIGRELPSGTTGEPLDFLVIEYIEGRSLAERIKQGPLPVHEALRLGIEIADALAAAHQQGIIHGDLKPANVMLADSTAGPVAKLLDFGLAELARPAADGSRQQPHGAAMAEAGSLAIVRGTLAYLAPEQFDGRERDARSDLFAFGCVQYEMLTGHRAFPGDTQASVISAIRGGEPLAPRTLQPLVAPALDRLVMRCLATDPHDRVESARSLADELRGIAVSPSLSTSGSSRSALHAPLAVAISAVILASIVAWGVWHIRQLAAVEPGTIVLAAPDGVRLGPGQSVAFSPDGRAVVFFGIKKSVSALYWHNLDEPDARLISGTESSGEGSLTPFFSPDGARLGLVRGGRLTTVPIQSGHIATGGAAVIAEGAGWVRGLSWGDDRTIVYSPNPYGGLWRVSAGASAREMTFPDRAKGELGHSWPEVLPGGRAALFTIRHASGRQDRSVIAAVELDSGRVIRLVEGGSYGRYASSGHLVYARNGSLLAVAFEPRSLAIRGHPVPVLGGVAMESAGSGSARFAISPNGALVYERAIPRSSAENALIWVDRDGQVEPVAPELRAYLPVLDLSPNGKTFVVRIESAARLDSQLWAYHIDRRHWQQLTFDGDNATPLFSPTGDRIVFSSNRDGAFNLYTMSVDGNHTVERMTRSPYWQYPSSWSADGRLLLYYQQDQPMQGTNMWILSLADRKAWRWGPENVNTFGARFSPDGRWITYQSRESGGVDVYVRPFPGPGPAVRVAGPNGGIAPFWSRDGRSILYLDGSTVMAARVHAGTSLRVSPPHLWFVLPFVPMIEASTNVLALDADGRRIAVVRPAPERVPRGAQLLVIPNWAEQLKTKLQHVR